MKRILTLVSLLAVSACANLEVAGPNRSAGQSDRALEFSARAVQPGQWMESPALQVEGQTGRIVVIGQLSTPDPCRTITGQLQGSGSDVVIEVAVRPAGEGFCIAVIGTFGYEAVIRGLAPGAYRLRVVHTYPETGWPTATVLDRQVQVR